MSLWAPPCLPARLYSKVRILRDFLRPPAPGSYVLLTLNCPDVTSRAARLCAIRRTSALRRMQSCRAAPADCSHRSCVSNRSDVALRPPDEPPPGAAIERRWRPTMRDRTCSSACVRGTRAGGGREGAALARSAAQSRRLPVRTRGRARSAAQVTIRACWLLTDRGGSQRLA